MSSPSNTFGSGLRRWRERVTPGEVGLTVQGRRRTGGLSRFELAKLSGVSVDYVQLLEQGRAAAPSVQVVTALARSLRLSPGERDDLFRAASLLPPSGDVPHEVPAPARRLLGQLGDRPVLLLAADWTVLDWNARWVAAAGDPALYGWPHDNMIAAAFPPAGGATVDEIGPWPIRSVPGPRATEADLVADLRLVAGKFPADARLAAMVADLIAASGRFAELWGSGTVAAHSGRNAVIEHPRAGGIEVACGILTPPGTDLKLFLMTATPGSPDEAKLNALR